MTHLLGIGSPALRPARLPRALPPVCPGDRRNRPPGVPEGRCVMAWLRATEARSWSAIQDTLGGMAFAATTTVRVHVGPPVPALRRAPRTAPADNVYLAIKLPTGVTHDGQQQISGAALSRTGVSRSRARAPGSPRRPPRTDDDHQKTRVAVQANHTEHSRSARTGPADSDSISIAYRRVHAKRGSR